MEITRDVAVDILTKLGFEGAWTLSPRRLIKKINRLHKVVTDDMVIEDEHLDGILGQILDELDNDRQVQVNDARPNMPAAERKKATESKRPRRELAERKTKYPWDKIFCGEVVVLEKGTDYDCKSQAMGVQVRAAAKRRGVQVRVAVKEESVIVQSVN